MSSPLFHSLLMLLMGTVAGTPSLPLQRAETLPARTLRPSAW